MDDRENDCIHCTASLVRGIDQHQAARAAHLISVNEALAPKLRLSMSKFRRVTNMNYKSILAILDDSKHVPGVITVATDLTRRFDAHLVGLYAVHAAAESHQLQEPWLAATMQNYAAKLEARARDCQAQFEKVTQSALGNKAEFRRADQDSVSVVTLMARYADLLVIGQRDPEESTAGVPASLVERSVLGVGRPVLVLPYYVSAYPNLGRNVLVAWNGTRESVRAVGDALPLLCRAQNVVIMAVNPEVSRQGHGEIPGMDLALYLARHGVKAEARPSVAPAIGVGDELLARASDMDADLLVMGAYGHSRVQELVMGGVTQTMMRHMTVPVLMSH
jgi:nucleotide-binding universal stress UspA family protein